METAGVRFGSFGGGAACRSSGCAGNQRGLIKMCAAGIKRPMLAIAADAIAGMVLMQGVVDPGSELVGVGDSRRRQAGIMFGEIECKKPVVYSVKRHDRMKIGAMPVENGDK